jgi:hypothetical protein
MDVRRKQLLCLGVVFLLSACVWLVSAHVISAVGHPSVTLKLNMNKLKCYTCHVTLQNQLGAAAMFLTLAVAETPSDANETAKIHAAQAFSAEWIVVGSQAIAVKTGMLETIAEQVLGWSAPTN